MTSQPLKSPHFYKKNFPLPPEQSQWIATSRTQISDIIKGRSDKLLVLVGPCSIHDVKAGLEYATKLVQLQKKLPYLKIVMRSYFEKPRTRHGWRGIVPDPFLNKSYDVPFGLELARKFLLNVNAMQLPSATEFLNPLYMNYFEDLVSMGMIGARTSASWIHRVMVSHLNMPVGFKNSTSGCVQTAIDAMLVASEPQHFTNINDEGHIASFSSLGNPTSFLTLRGSRRAKNSDPASIKDTLFLLKKEKLPPSLLIDCAHGNSHGPKEQKQTFLSVLDQIKNGNDSIFGLMLESFLFSGSSSIEEKKYGTSITDACIDFETTQDLLTKANEVIYQDRLNRTKADV